MINETDLEAWEYYNKPADDARLRCMTPTDMVQEFMHLTGQTPTAALYFKLIQEEHLEWLNEWKMGINPAAELKELADLVYVIYGYAISKGWDLDEELRRTHKNNIRLIHEEHLEWLNEWKMGINPDSELKKLSNLVYAIYGYAISKGWDLDEALFRTHKNNVGRSTQDDGSILRREDGKIIKNPNYKKVTLEDLV